MMSVRDSYDPGVSVDGAGPPVVCVPGMDGTGKLFYRQTPLLARDYRVATYALRDTTSEMETLIDDLAGVIRSISPSNEPAIILGESFGGTLALSFALKRPELVRALVIVNSFPHFLPQTRLRIVISTLQVFPWKAMTLVRQFTATRLHSQFTHRNEIRRFLKLTTETTRRGYLNRLRILKRYDVRDQLHRITAPTLLLAAEEDHLVPSVDQAQYMAQRLPRATSRVLHGHGHICLIAPNINLGNILSDWLTSCRSG